VLTPLLLASIALPIVVAVALAAHPIASERAVARVALGAATASALMSLLAIGLWTAGGAHAWSSAPRTLFAHGSFRFDLELRIDGAAAVFLTLVQFITATVLRFSRFYLHREPGFQRFFATVLMFQGAMCALALAGNLEVMFAAWEIVGLASFLLIAFYRERQSAIRNALKTYSVYRVADIGILLAACLERRSEHHAIGFLLLLAALGKSAQFPFSFWIPRAMEGPTPSSALFYGGLSVHAGAYLLLRTEPLWHDVSSVRIAIAAFGLVTAALCSMFSRVQPTIKAQVGYASITQVGVIFVEIALGMKTLALVHLVTNALLRFYQLLVSPSAVAYLLRRHAGAGAPTPSEAHSRYGRLSRRARATLFAFALNEGYLKEVVKGALWSPLRRLGAAALPRSTALAAVASTTVVAALVWAPRASEEVARGIGCAALAAAVLASSCAIGAWPAPRRAIGWIFVSSMAAVAAAFAVAPAKATFAVAWAASMVAVFCALALLGTALVVPQGRTIRRFAGLADASWLRTACALVGVLGIAGFPLLPSFLSADLLLDATLDVSVPFSIVTAIVLAANGYLSVRIFAFTFLGRAMQVDPPVAEPSSASEKLTAAARASASSTLQSQVDLGLRR